MKARRLMCKYIERQGRVGFISIPSTDTFNLVKSNPDPEETGILRSWKDLNRFNLRLWALTFP